MEVEMVLWLRERDVKSVLKMEMALEAVEAAFRGLAEGSAVNQPRRRIQADRGLFHFMASAVGSRQALGLKAYGTFGGQIEFLVPLYSSETGRLLALVEGDWLGRMRTDAASGVATKYMARPEAKTLGLFGTGSQALTQILAVCAVRPIERVNVYSRSPEKCAAFAAEAQKHVTAQIVAVDEPRAAVEQADVIVTITASQEPVFPGDMLPPGGVFTTRLILLRSTAWAWAKETY